MRAGLPPTWVAVWVWILVLAPARAEDLGAEPKAPRPVKAGAEVRGKNDAESLGAGTNSVVSPSDPRTKRIGTGGKPATEPAGSMTPPPPDAAETRAETLTRLK